MCIWSTRGMCPSLETPHLCIFTYNSLHLLRPVHRLKMKMCLALRRRTLVPLVVALLSQSAQIVAGQEVEQLFYLALEPIELPGLNRPPASLLANFKNGGNGVYLKEVVQNDDIAGMIEIGWTPMDTANSDQMIQETEVQLNGDMYETESRQTEKSTLNYYTLSEFRDPDNKADPSRLILRFENGHKLVWFPYNGLPFTWIAGTEEFRKGLDDAPEPIFIRGNGGLLRIDGANGWDHFACGTPTSEEGYDTQSESQSGSPPIAYWQIQSLQRAVLNNVKVPGFNTVPTDCIPIQMTLKPITDVMTANMALAAEELADKAIDLLQQESVEVEENTDSDDIYKLDVQIENGPYTNAEAQDERFQFNFDDSEGLTPSNARLGGSRFLSHVPQTARLIEEETDSDEENYDNYIDLNSQRQSEQADNSQSEEALKALDLPEFPVFNPVNRANSMINTESGQRSWMQSGFPRLTNRYHSTGELLSNRQNGGLLRALASKSDEAFGNNMNPNGGILKLATTKSEEIETET